MIKEKPYFVVLQKTKLNLIDFSWVSKLWGSDDCNFIQKPKIGKSGGQLLIWDENLFEAETVDDIECGIGIRGTWKNLGCKFNLMNIYGPQDDVKKQKLWDSVSRLVSGGDEAWVLCEDFNEVRDHSERFNCEFIDYRAKWFNEFIENNRLIDIPMGGRNFTRVSDDGLKYSKLDLFLTNDKFISIWRDLTAMVLDRHLSDHCPIILKDDERNFGPKPFKVFDIWFSEDDVVEVISKAWDTSVVGGSRKDSLFKNKLKNVKMDLKDWSKNKFHHIDGEIEQHMSIANGLEQQAEVRVLNEDELKLWREARKKWFEKENIKSNM
ncbi:uncharacterized protein [Rutidosis leptorrhynchoides]|uniref:uncharacterized protein n=1 Tax=Rutidosis leptorrhynchoides TaxID=125765 RepID=UPI003A9A0BF1